MNNSTDTEVNNDRYYAIGATGLICLLLLLLFLIVEVFYIRRYKTDFLQRLFFYLTIAATIAEGAIIALVFTKSAAFKAVIFDIYFTSIGCIFYAYLVEVLVFAAMNFTVLSKLYKCTARRHSLHSDKEYILFCCLYTKRKEVVFVVILFFLPVSCTK